MKFNSNSNTVTTDLEILYFFNIIRRLSKVATKSKMADKSFDLKTMTLLKTHFSTTTTFPPFFYIKKHFQQYFHLYQF